MMKISLDSFEKQIDDNILKKGLSLYKSDSVSKCDEISKDEYIAVIKSPIKNTVDFKLNGREIVSFSCDCGNLKTSVCEHVTAVIFYFLEDELGLLDETTKLLKPLTRKAPKKKSIADKLKSLIDKVPPDELKQFLHLVLKKNPQLKVSFFSEFSKYESEISLEYFEDQINMVITSSIDKYGYMVNPKDKSIDLFMDKLFNNALDFISDGRYTESFMIYSAIINQIRNSIRKVHDFNLDLKQYIKNSIAMIDLLLGENLSPELKKEITDYCILAINSSFHPFDFLEVIINAIETESEADEIIALIDKLAANASENDREELQLNKYNILKEFKSSEEAENFLRDRITNFRIRDIAIQKALGNNEFNKALGLVKDGIKLLGNSSNTFVVDLYYLKLLKIYQALEDNDNIIETAKYLLLNYHHEVREHYDILKQLVPQERWELFLERLIDEATRFKTWYCDDLVRKIYVWEEKWDELFDNIVKQDSISDIHSYGAYLKKEHLPKIYDIYANHIYKTMERNAHRYDYSTVCMYLWQMHNLGGTDKAKEIKETLRNTYPRRRTLIDMLNFLKFK